MKVTELKPVTENKKVTVGIKCDVCGTVHPGTDTPDEWHHFNHHHHEWGNDSIDSYEYHDVCSPKCYWLKFRECVYDLRGRHDAKIDDFEIQFARLLIESIKEIQK